MDLQYAVSFLETKSLDDDLREIEGVATCLTADRMGDIVEPSGATFSLPLPLLWQHDTRQPIGEVVEARVLPTGILIRARIAKILEPGALQTRVNEAWHSIKARLVKGLSVGFRPTDLKPLRGGGY